MFDWWEYGGLLRGDPVDVILGVAILAYAFGFVSGLYFVHIWWKRVVLKSWEAVREMECEACRKRK